jgi:hypothetical protein
MLQPTLISVKVPFLRYLAQDPQSTAVFIYPTKVSRNCNRLIRILTCILAGSGARSETGPRAVAGLMSWYGIN